MYVIIFPSFLFYTLSKMETVIEIEFLPGNNEQVIKEAAIASDDAHIHFLFRPPYPMEPHGSKENGLNREGQFLLYSQVQTVLTEALAPYDHLYAWGDDKCLLGDILNRQINNLEALECPVPSKRKSEIHCHLPCHSFPDMRCALRNADAQHSWLRYHLQLKLLSSVRITIRGTLQSFLLVFPNLILSCDHITCFRGGI